MRLATTNQHSSHDARLSVTNTLQGCSPNPAIRIEEPDSANGSIAGDIGDAGKHAISTSRTNVIFGNSSGDRWEADAVTPGLSTATPLRPARGGLQIPRFRPTTIRTLLIDGETETEPVLSNTPGKRKGPKNMRIAGDRSASVQYRGVMHGYGLTGNTSMIDTNGRSVNAGKVDALGVLGDELLISGILQESDWTGSFGSSIQQGLNRWANQTMGCERLRILGPLQLVYTDDAYVYASGIRLTRWKEHFKARADRPVGFFGLRWQESPVKIKVRRKIEALEAVFPGYGYGLIELLQRTFLTAVNGYTFYWGKQMAHTFSQLDQQMFRDAIDGSPFHGDPLDDFDKHIPVECVSKPFRLDYAQDVAEICRTNATYAEFAPITAQAMEVWNACRAAGLKFYMLNHGQFLGWAVGEVDPNNMEAVSERAIKKLERAPTCFLQWTEDDPMERLIDDYGYMARQIMGYSDLSWIHAFQVGFSGSEPTGARNHIAANERLVRKIGKSHPEAISWIDKDYQPEPMPDGSVGHAITALAIVLRIVMALDGLLDMLHTPETLLEMAAVGRL